MSSPVKIEAQQKAGLWVQKNQKFEFLGDFRMPREKEVEEINLSMPPAQENRFRRERRRPPVHYTTSPKDNSQLGKLSEALRVRTTIPQLPQVTQQGSEVSVGGLPYGVAILASLDFVERGETAEVIKHNGEKVLVGKNNEGLSVRGKPFDRFTEVFYDGLPFGVLTHVAEIRQTVEIAVYGSEPGMVNVRLELFSNAPPQSSESSSVPNDVFDWRGNVVEMDKDGWWNK